jgi:hypothetical protein
MSPLFTVAMVSVSALATPDAKNVAATAQIIFFIRIVFLLDVKRKK